MNEGVNAWIHEWALLSVLFIAIQYDDIGLCLAWAEDWQVWQVGKQAGGYIHGAKESAKRYSIDIIMSVAWSQFYGFFMFI